MVLYIIQRKTYKLSLQTASLNAVSNNSRNELGHCRRLDPMDCLIRTMGNEDVLEDYVAGLKLKPLAPKSATEGDRNLGIVYEHL